MNFANFCNQIGFNSAIISFYYVDDNIYRVELLPGFKFTGKMVKKNKFTGKIGKKR
jgi:hypothetical protein